MDVRSEADRYLLKFTSYVDYLDSLVTPDDIRYIGSIDRARAITQFGARNIAEILTEEEFKKRRAAVIKAQSRKPHLLCSANLQFYDPFLAELAQREEPNRIGHLLTIVFVRDLTDSGEVSAYMDYAERLGKDDWRPVFQGDRRITPRHSDLSYHDWRTGVTYFNNSRNFTNNIRLPHGLVFTCCHDSEAVVVDPGMNNSSTRLTEVRSPNYAQVLLFDHVVRRR